MKKSVLILALLPSFAFAGDLDYSISIFNGEVAGDVTSMHNEEIGNGGQLGLHYDNWSATYHYANTENIKDINRFDLTYGYSHNLVSNISLDVGAGVFSASSSATDSQNGGTGSLGLSWNGDSYYVSSGVATTYYASDRDEFSNNMYVEMGFTIDVVTFSIGYDESIAYMQISF